MNKDLFVVDKWILKKTTETLKIINIDDGVWMSHLQQRQQAYDQ